MWQWMYKTGMLLISILTTLTSSPVLSNTLTFAASNTTEDTKVSSIAGEGEVKTHDLTNGAGTDPKIQNGHLSTDKLTNNSPEIRDGTILKKDVKPNGITGERGPLISIGSAGAKGEKGDADLARPKLETGEQGLQGGPGDRGPPGQISGVSKLIVHSCLVEAAFVGGTRSVVFCNVPGVSIGDFVIATVNRINPAPIRVSEVEVTSANTIRLILQCGACGGSPTDLLETSINIIAFHKP